ncbi:hypothetical protein ENSA5_06600 [Enhygromyxa salina]|uniref:Uncharacterized protein n=1 Tax=Enhygromyxa salina TaxID=215803 RepID=A0A2S9YHP2_9BACT|nr:hypothetical protein ENSA5_06600 [Enhygromyxa salina]
MLGWALAPALASLAIVVQISLDVPRGEMLEREPKKTKTKRKSAATRSTPRPDAWKARGVEEVEQLRARWSERPFADEPTDPSFRRRHEALLRSVATRARAEVLRGERPTPMQIRPACHTIRCELELCGPKPMIDGIAALLPGVTVVDQPLWHELREIETVAKVSKRSGTAREDHVCRRWLVDFAIEGPAPKDLRMPDAEAAG